MLLPFHSCHINPFYLGSAMSTPEKHRPFLLLEENYLCGDLFFWGGGEQEEETHLA